MNAFNKSKFIITICFLMMITLSCHKEGIGGKSYINGTVKHHTKPIPYAVVYIKYGATEFPGTDVTAYDDHTTSDVNGNYEYTNLRKGNYYLYGVGYDNAIALPVTGGIPITVYYNKSYNTDVPVTE